MVRVKLSCASSTRELVNGFGGKREFGCSFDVENLRAGPDIDGEDIVGNGGPVVEEHFAGFGVDAACFGVYDAGSCGLGEIAQVDVCLVVRVVSGDVAGQHARIGCEKFAGDQGDRNIVEGSHCALPEHFNLAVAATQHYEFFHICYCTR